MSPDTPCARAVYPTEEHTLRRRLQPAAGGKEFAESIHTRIEKTCPPLLPGAPLGPITWHMISKDLDRYRYAIETC